MSLTPKQEKFCQEYVKTGVMSEAYRLAYEVKKMLPDTINRAASAMFDNYKITTRVKELEKALENRALYSLEQSVKRDVILIERYESALDVLEDIYSGTKDVEVAERMIKYIGATGYSQAQDRLSKQHGFFEQDNKQKATITIEPLKPVIFKQSDE